MQVHECEIMSVGFFCLTWRWPSAHCPRHYNHRIWHQVMAAAAVMQIVGGHRVIRFMCIAYELRPKLDCCSAELGPSATPDAAGTWDGGGGEHGTLRLSVIFWSPLVPVLSRTQKVNTNWFKINPQDSCASRSLCFSVSLCRITSQERAVDKVHWDLRCTQLFGSGLDATESLQGHRSEEDSLIGSFPPQRVSET